LPLWIDCWLLLWHKTLHLKLAPWISYHYSF